MPLMCIVVFFLSRRMYLYFTRVLPCYWLDCVQQGVLRWNRFQRNPAEARKYLQDLTGFRSVGAYEAFYDVCNYRRGAESLHQRNSGFVYANEPKSGRRKLSPIDGMLLCLVRLRCGLTENTVAFMFGISQPTVSRVFEMWLQHLHFVLRTVFPPPDQMSRSATCPKAFKHRMKTDNAFIVDCSDLQVEVSSDPQLQYATWSEYHHFNGVKILGVVTPCGSFVYSSPAFPARASDNAVTELSGFLRYLEKGDTFVADKGFTLFYKLNKLDCFLYIPPFKKQGVDQFSTQELDRTSTVANLRIHVERAFERTKSWKIFDRPLPILMLDLAGQMFYVCSMLSNMQRPLVNTRKASVTGEL